MAGGAKARQQKQAQAQSTQQQATQQQQQAMSTSIRPTALVWKAAGTQSNDGADALPSARQSIDAALQDFRNAVAAVAIGAVIPGMAIAQSQTGAAPGPWKYTASINLFLPTIGGSSTFPAEGTPIDISAEQILNALKMTFMGTFDAHNGSWGVMTDLVYVDLGGSKSNSRDFTIGNGLPAGTTADLDLDYKATAWTIAGEYRVSSNPSWTMDLLAGARLFDNRQRLRWSISGDIGPLPPTSRTGSAELNHSVWDGTSASRVAMCSAPIASGPHRSTSTSAPASLPAPCRQSPVQLRFEWGEFNTLWRYLKYNAKSGQAVTSVSFSGPQIGAVFRW